jgi:periplasmic divalent cation tolerance protein
MAETTAPGTPISIEFVLVLVTVPDSEVADRISKVLVGEKLAACVNIVPGIRSVYAWNGEICDEGELQCLIKTRRSLFAAVRERVKELHPYQIPEIIALPLVEGNAEYLGWLRGSTRAS